MASFASRCRLDIALLTTGYIQDSSIKYYTCTQRVQIYANEIYVEYTYKTRD